MNNKIHPSKDHHSSFQLLDISAYIESFNLDPQHTSISLKIINRISFRPSNVFLPVNFIKGYLWVIRFMYISLMQKMICV